jgi:uncharacterized RDD family membrane protein YckC
MLDTSLNGSLLAFLLGIIFYTVDAADADPFITALGHNRAVDAIFTCLMAIPGNAVAIGLSGGSVGKWFFGIRVLDAAGQTIGIGRALRRESSVWVRGLGFGIPIITLITLIVAFKHLTKSGTTSWDQETGMVIVHRSHGPRQIFLSVLGIASVIALFAGLAAL